MKLNGTRGEKKSPRKITEFQPKNGGQKTTLQLTRVKSSGVSMRKLQLERKQASKIFSIKTQEYSPFSENNQAFYSFSDFSFHFTSVSGRKVPF